MWVQSAPLLNEQQVLRELEQTEATKNQPEQGQIQQALQSALNAFSEQKNSLAQISLYQQAIDDFPMRVQELYRQIESVPASQPPVPKKLSVQALNQQILQISSQLLEKNRNVQQQQQRLRDITDSLMHLPQQQTELRRQLDETERRLASQPDSTTALAQAQQMALQAEVLRLKARVEELELAQLSASNRQTLARLQGQLAQKQSVLLDEQLQELRHLQNDQRQQTAQRALATAQILAASSEDLPSDIAGQFHIDQQLSQALSQQAQRLDSLNEQQRLVNSQITQARQVLITLREQAQGAGVSSELGEALRAQVARLPELPQSRPLDTEMAQLRVQRIRYEDLLSKQPQLRQHYLTADSPLNITQRDILDRQLNSQRDVINALLQGGDSLVLELTRLKVAGSQLEDILQQVREATHRYLFWTADASSISTEWVFSLGRDLRQFISLDTFSQLGNATIMLFTSKQTLLPLFLALILVGISISSRRHFSVFLQRSAARVGKVTQDDFRLTVRTLFWSILVALPLPVLWMALGYGWREAWPYPIAVAAGESVTATVPLLWVVMICAVFARNNGLFISHFGWPRNSVAKAMRYYLMSIGFIVPLIIILTMFNHFNDRQFATSLGRLSFMLICGALVSVTLSLKRAGIPLWINKQGNSDNLINTLLWYLLLCAPLLALLAAAIGYLSTAQALLVRLETSVAIWFLLLVIYCVIRRWMLIQKRRLAFDRAKQRRAEILAQRARNDDDTSSIDSSSDSDEPEIDLDTISAQSLRLVRSILLLIALLLMIALWSEIHSAFSFLENITLWNVSNTINGVESQAPVTLGAVFIALLIFIISLQLVRNLPALLELALLQHLDLAPGTGYAITTSTKYLLMLIGALAGFSLLGIEWSKLQWLVAALGVGLGFGLQEIFANFISGLIILYEKPIRIGDTVTIHDLTGSVTRINTRATTISDWDRKEIIVPNKAFITEQFINWSLTDSITRVVLNVPASAEASSEQITELLQTAAQRCPQVLDTPAPEIYLVDLQQGIQIFEIRVYAADMMQRMPLRHELHQLILQGFAEHGVELPFPPFQVRQQQVTRQCTISSGRPRKTGDL